MTGLLGRRRLEALAWLCRAVSPLFPAGTVTTPPAVLWPVVVALADQHLLLPELALALHRHGLAAGAPGDLVALLDDIHALNRERNAALRAQMRDMAQAFAAAGLAPVWLKGAVELLDPGWETGGRMMNDLDLWFPDPADQAAALACLDRLGYTPMPGEEDGAWSGSHHYAGRTHPAWLVRVELHRTIVGRACHALLPDHEALPALVWQEWEGCRTARLCARDRVRHSLIQATAMAVPRMESGRMPLMKALDTVRRCHADFGGTVPPDLAAVLAAPAWADYAPPFLTLAEGLFGLPNPLAADDSMVDRLAVVTATPRLAFLTQTLERLFSRRFLRKLARPAALPAAFARYAHAFLTGRDHEG